MQINQKAAAKAQRWKKGRDDKRQKSRTDVFDQIMGLVWTKQAHGLARIQRVLRSFLTSATLSKPVRTLSEGVRSVCIQVRKLQKSTGWLES